MKKIGEKLKKLLIIYFIVYIAISSMSTSFARTYDAKCGEYVSEYARDFIEKYGGQSTYSLQEATWTGGSIGKGELYVCCNTGINYMFQLALNVNLNDYGWSDTGTMMATFPNQYFKEVSASELQPGDIVLSNSHVEMYIGNGQNANFGSTGEDAAVIANGPRLGTSFSKAFRLTGVEVDPAGTVPMESTEIEDEDLSIYDENGFIYSGVAEIKSYKEGKSIGKFLIDSILQVLSYIIGIPLLLIRMTIVGWIAIIERFVMDGIVNTVTGVKNERVDNWQEDPNSIDEIDKEIAQEEAENATTNSIDNTPQATGEPGDENYISEGMQGIADIGGDVQLETSSEANVTIENIVYNKIPILDINFFNFESAGGAVVDENGIIYIIKENVAMWYYIFRILAITIMLVILIYLGIKLTITSSTEKKAAYKEMLTAWVVGFILIFAMNYIMLGVISLNESLINFIIPEYENGQEISLYESVRTKAYEIRNSTGYVGMILYGILVYFSIRFLIVYFKRYLTIMILALLSPFIGIAYALEKINKKGRGQSQIYGNWLKDFMYTVFIQTIHALIYTIFIHTVLILTETSLFGTILAFIFLNFMLKVDPIMRKIFGFSNKGNAAKLSVAPLGAQIATAKWGLGEVKKISGGFTKNVLSPFGTVAKAAGGAGSRRLGRLRNAYYNSQIPATIVGEDRRRAIAEKEKSFKQKMNTVVDGAKQVALGANIALKTASAVGKAVASVPLMIVEPELGTQVLESASTSASKVKKSLKLAKSRGYVTPGQMFKRKAGNTIHNLRNYHKQKYQRRIRKLQRKGIGINYNIRDEFSPEEWNQVVSKDTDINDLLKLAHRLDNTNLSEDELNEIKRKIKTRININNLEFASHGKTIEEILNSGDKDSIYDALLYSIYLSTAKDEEGEIKEEFRELTGLLNDNILKNEEKNPEFARILKEKQSKEIIETTKQLTKPLSEKDILQAMQNYKQKVPSFNMQAEELSEQEIRGITEEINKILTDKGQNIVMGEAFLGKVQKELTNNQRRLKEERERQEKFGTIAGEDVSRKGQNIVTENKKDVKEKVRKLNTNDRQTRSATDNPKDSHINPHDIEGNKSLDKLTNNARNQPGRNESINNANTTIHFARRTDDNDNLGENYTSPRETAPNRNYIDPHAIERNLTPESTARGTQDYINQAERRGEAPNRDYMDPHAIERDITQESILSMAQDIRERIEEDTRTRKKSNISSDEERILGIANIVKSIQEASKGTDSKDTRYVPKNTVNFAKRLENLDRIGRASGELTNESSIYNIDEILERLKNL